MLNVGRALAAGRRLGNRAIKRPTGPAAAALSVGACCVPHLAGGSTSRVGASQMSTDAAAAAAAAPETSSSGAEKGYGVLIWGQGSMGELGHTFAEGAAKEELTPRPLAGYEEGGAASMDCGLNHSALAQTDGKLLTWGAKANHKLGHAAAGAANSCWRPAVVEALEDVKIVNVACGDHHTAAVDEEGRLFTWGWAGSWTGGMGGLGLPSTSGDVSSPTLVQSLLDDGVRVAKVGAGEKHTVVVTDDGEAWACGNGEYGMLGNGGSSDRDVPAPVETLEDYIVTDVAVGHSFNLALTSEGLVFGWGRNDAGQLGLGGGLAMDVYAMEEFPRLIESLASTEKVVAIAAGVSHAAAATEDGKLFMWGMKRYLEPEYMTVLEGKKVVSVGCGDRYTAVVTSDNEVYTFGPGKTCCLGHGDKSTRAQPTLVKALVGRGVERIICGHRHAAALARPYLVGGRHAAAAAAAGSA